MKETAVFLVGSRYFFGGIDGFSCDDSDYVHLMSEWYLPQKSLLFHDGDVDRFLYPDEGLSLIDDCLSAGDPLTAGKFLVRGFCDHIGATLDDVKRLETLFFALDGKHRYETRIYECYVENGGLWLKESQLFEAYEIYKESRGF